MENFWPNYAQLYQPWKIIKYSSAYFLHCSTIYVFFFNLMMQLLVHSSMYALSVLIFFNVTRGSRSSKPHGFFKALLPCDNSFLCCTSECIVAKLNWNWPESNEGVQFCSFMWHTWNQGFGTYHHFHPHTWGIYSTHSAGIVIMIIIIIISFHLPKNVRFFCCIGSKSRES